MPGLRQFLNPINFLQSYGGKSKDEVEAMQVAEGDANGDGGGDGAETPNENAEENMEDAGCEADNEQMDDTEQDFVSIPDENVVEQEVDSVMTEPEVDPEPHDALGAISGFQDPSQTGFQVPIAPVRKTSEPIASRALRASSTARPMTTRARSATQSMADTIPDEEKHVVSADLVKKLNEKFAHIEQVRKGMLEEDYAVAELKENLKQFRKLRTQFTRLSKDVTKSQVRKEMDRIHQQMVTLCGDEPNLRADLRDFKRDYTAFTKLHKRASRG